MNDLDNIEQRINRLAPQREPTATVIPFVPKTIEKQSKLAGWRFVPERDANNLIIEIIATPIKEPVDG